MSGKFIFVTALWLSAILSIKTSIDVFIGSNIRDLSPVTECRNMLSSCINTFLNSSKHAFNQCSFTDLSTDPHDFTAKWKVNEDPNPPEWMEEGILLP